MELRIYTDGSIDKNPGRIGGWAFVIVLSDGREIRDSGGYQLKGVTNNHSEITAVTKGLLRAWDIRWRFSIPDDVGIVVVSDSQYVINQAEKKWKRKKNKWLLAKLDEAVEKTGATFEWVRGHNGVLGNEIVDKLAGLEVKRLQAREEQAG